MQPAARVGQLDPVARAERAAALVGAGGVGSGSRGPSLGAEGGDDVLARIRPITRPSTTATNRARAGDAADGGDQVRPVAARRRPRPGQHDGDGGHRRGARASGGHDGRGGRRRTRRAGRRATEDDVPGAGRGGGAAASATERWPDRRPPGGRRRRRTGRRPRRGRRAPPAEAPLHRNAPMSAAQTTRRSRAAARRQRHHERPGEHADGDDPADPAGDDRAAVPVPRDRPDGGLEQAAAVERQAGDQVEDADERVGSRRTRAAARPGCPRDALRDREEPAREQQVGDRADDRDQRAGGGVATRRRTRCARPRG